IRQGYAIDHDVAGERTAQAHNETGDRRLAGSGLADKTKRFPAIDRERHVGRGDQDLARQMLDRALEPRLREVISQRDVLDPDQRRIHDAATPVLVSYSQQATREGWCATS